MNPGLKGRDMRKAFDTPDYTVMIVAQKFQTGFDQPKLCAMYVDKPLGGLECVQTLSRLNRTFPGKDKTYVLDFVNDPDDVLAAFQEYYQTATLLDTSDPDHIWELEEKLKQARIFTMAEVTHLAEVFYMKSKSQAALSNVMKPAVERWTNRYKQAYQDAEQARMLFERTKKTGDAVLIANAEGELKDAKKELDALGSFKADLRSFTRYYEFMSQIVDYDSTDLEKLSLYTRHLYPLLRESTPEADLIDLSSVELSHYRLSKLKQQTLSLARDAHQGLSPASSVGTRKPRDKNEEFLSQIISRLNELFVTDGLTENDLLDYARTIANKVGENSAVTDQMRNNAAEQAILGDFSPAVDDAVMESGEAHQNLMNQVLTNDVLAAGFRRVVFNLVVAQMKGQLPDGGPMGEGRG